MESSIPVKTNLLQSAADHLKQAEKNYEEAKATLQSARSLYEATETSQNALINSAPRAQLCSSCQSIPIVDIFRKTPPFKVPRCKVGDLFAVVETRWWCILCKFLMEAFQLGDPEGTERLHAQLNLMDTAIYFAQDTDGQPWFQKAGVSTDMKPAPFVWLQTGPRTQTGQPHLCITFQRTTDTGEDTLLSPRLKGRLEEFNGSIDYDLVLSWLKKCSGSHSACRPDEVSPNRPSTSIYLIDTHTKTIVRSNTRTRYVALSYVWGMGPFNDSSHFAPSKSSANLPPDGTMRSEMSSKLPATIPQTIQDALIFVERIGERYLWVDLFCIDQANDEDKHDQINCMDQIYSSAFLTLIALDGSNADSGLPGVSISLQQSGQPTVSLEPGRLTATYIYSVWDNNGKSIHDTRAWTLQERLLSRRCIIFASTSIYMQCRTEFFHDSVPFHHEADGVKTWLGDDFFREDGSGISLDETEWDFKTWDALVSVYSSRKLSYESDALNACRGSLNRITLKTGYEFCFGLPRLDFLRALLWKPHHEHVLVRRSEFPSWSWLGWFGRAECAYWVGDMADYADREGEDVPEPSAKRRRPLLKKSGPDAAEIIAFPSEEDKVPAIILKTTVTRFRVDKLRKNSTKWNKLASRGQKSNAPIGNHWTLLDSEGDPLRDLAGELPRFESTGHFFRVDNDSSQVLKKRDGLVDLVFIHYWPRLRDSNPDERGEQQWLYNMVSALVVVLGKDGKCTRYASVLLEAEQWYSRDPYLKTVHIV